MNYAPGLSNISHGILWFSDGNIVLVPEAESMETAIAFKVHRGVVARHSEVFESIFELPQPTGDAEAIDGCPVVHMVGDKPHELGNFLKALYDGCVFQHRSINDFFYLAGILRLATKYAVHRLRLQAIEQLTKTWSYTLEGHDSMVARALSTPAIGGASYPFVHPLHVLNLVHETHVTVVLPAVLYFLSIYSLADLLRADHAKLRVKHPSVPSSQLSHEGLRDYTLMYQHRLDMMLEFTHKVCGDRDVDAECHGEPFRCRRSFTRLTYQIATALSVRTGVFHNMLQAISWIEADDAVCDACKRSFRRDVNVQREEWWKTLPSVLGLPDWEKLVAMDLSPESQ
ncbi:hypothetical protein PENSPDRAFT_631993 [Peniophora sp. CONT]|nr:hypothetical protein PENSPDRAFT_631993 [Peniophora sp. CONT]